MKNDPFPPLLPPAANTHTFILRIWQERGDGHGNRPIWRGLIEKVGLNQRAFFFSFDGLLRFLQEQTGITIQSRRCWWESIFPWYHHED